VAKVASTSKKPPHHDRVVAGDSDNQIDGDHDHDFNWHKKAGLLKLVHRLILRSRQKMPQCNLAERANKTAKKISSKSESRKLLQSGLTDPSCRYRAPFKLQEVVQVTVLPPMHDLQTLTHWFICFAS
jgi:hypothetical protein